MDEGSPVALNTDVAEGEPEQHEVVGLLTPTSWDHPEFVRQAVSLGHRLDENTVKGISLFVQQVPQLVVESNSPDEVLAGAVDHFLPAVATVELFPEDELVGDPEWLDEERGS